MGLLSKIKSFFTPNFDSDLPVNFTMVLDSFDSFMAHVNNTNDFDDHYVYYYAGDSKNLANIISNDTYRGEDSIPDISLSYIGETSVVKNNLMLVDILFFPDQVFDIKNKFASIDHTEESKCLYKSDNTGMHTINGFVIASKNVYFCAK